MWATRLRCPHIQGDCGLRWRERLKGDILASVDRFGAQSRGERTQTSTYTGAPVLDPTCTQHSLPSGRYPLLGPDLHRLDRTSLRLAHLLDHLIGDGEHPWRHLDAEHSRRLQVKNELKFGRLQHRQVRGLGAL